MKSTILSFIVCMLIFTSCNHKAKPLTISSKDKVSIDLNSVGVNTAEMQKKMDELKKLTPLTTDQLKAMVPGELLGIKRSGLNANNMAGFSATEATYSDSSSDKRIDLSIFDCAGEAGAGVYSLSYLTKMNMESQTDNGYSKTIDFNGQKAVESYDKGIDRYELNYIASDRLLITIKVEKLGLDAIKQIANSLNLKTN
ncbi:MAG TPA: hypothetical protein VGI82_10655 [Chitinophagaceae bacterium]